MYCFTSSAGLTGQLVLDALGDPTAIFTFQIVSTLITSADASVVMANGGRARNVSWQVGSAVTIGANSSLLGNLIAFTSVTFGHGATLTGRALVRGAVTMDSNIVSVPP